MAINIVPTELFNRAIRGDKEAAEEATSIAYGAFLVAEDEAIKKAAREEGLMMYFAWKGPLATHGEDMANNPILSQDLELMGRDLVYETGLFKSARQMFIERDQQISDGWLAAYERVVDGPKGPRTAIFVDIAARAEPEYVIPPERLNAAAKKTVGEDGQAAQNAAIEQAGEQFGKLPVSYDNLKSSLLNRFRKAKEAEGMTFDLSENGVFLQEQLNAAIAGDESASFDLAENDAFVREQLNAAQSGEPSIFDDLAGSIPSYSEAKAWVKERFSSAAEKQRQLNKSLVLSPVNSANRVSQPGVGTILSESKPESKPEEKGGSALPLILAGGAVVAGLYLLSRRGK